MRVAGMSPSIAASLTDANASRCHADLPPYDADGSKSARVSSRNALYSRSLYHFALIYNRLPQDLVNLGSVSAFQSQLTKFAFFIYTRALSVGGTRGAMLMRIAGS